MTLLANDSTAGTALPTTPAPDFGNATGLVCRECGASYDLGAAYACRECFGPLEVAYDLSGITRESIEAGPQSLWRYSAFLPVAASAGGAPNLNPGMAQLVRAGKLVPPFGMTAPPWVKSASGEPTPSPQGRAPTLAHLWGSPK